MFLCDSEPDEQPCKFLVTNLAAWEVSGILLVYRYRWLWTETFHRGGKQKLARGDRQLRGGQREPGNMSLVIIAYTLHMNQLGHDCAKAWALRKPTVGGACRAVLRELQGANIAWATEKPTKYSYDVDHFPERLRLT